MMNRMIARFSVVFALAAVLTASPATAQGKGNDKKGEKAKQGEVAKGKKSQKRPELQRRDREDERLRRTDVRRRDGDRYEDGRYDDRSSNRTREQDRGVPAFCRNGQGHPKFGWRWCEERGYGRDRARTDGRYDDRYGRDTYSRSGRYGSYEEAHLDFHRYLDRKYSDLADDRPLDPMYQIRIRRDRKAEHDRWHAEQGQRHTD